LSELASRHVLSLLVEGGPRVHAGFVTENWADEWYSFISPLIIGGRAAPTAIAGDGVAFLKDASVLENLEIHKSGEDVVIHGYFPPANKSPRLINSEQEGTHV
jgi:diaminohydroxyphosphoribosylaminopyrimidine deaminase/5-amino-6-(5-phosphoribosylamino)uracil reductase